MFKINKNRYYPAVAFDNNEQTEKLPPGFYTVDFQSDGMSKLLFFEKYTVKGKVIPFKGKYEAITQKLLKFFDPATREMYKTFEYPYMLGGLFYGKPGTGKSTYIRGICRELIKNYGAICLFIDSYNHLEIVDKLIKALRNGDGEEELTPVVIIMDDFENLLVTNQIISYLLRFTEGFYNTPGVMTLVTTNFIKNIGDNIKRRPTRFAIVERFDTIDADVIENYIVQQLKMLSPEQLAVVKKKVNVAEVIEKMREASIPVDYIKNILLDQVVYGLNIDESIQRVERTYKAKVAESAGEEEF